MSNFNDIRNHLQSAMDALFLLDDAAFLADGSFKKLVLIVDDLHKIREKSESDYIAVYLCLVRYPASYLDIGKELNITKQAVHKTMVRLSLKYDWIDTLLAMRSRYKLVKKEENEIADDT